MRKYSVIIACTILCLCFGCSSEKVRESQVEGFWEAVYSKRTAEGVVEEIYYDEITKVTKIFGAKNFAFVRMYPRENGSTEMTTMGGKGTYELRGDTLIETIELFPDQEMVGARLYYLYEIHGDTLIQKGPVKLEVPSGWEDFQLYESYIRKE